MYKYHHGTPPLSSTSKVENNPHPVSRKGFGGGSFRFKEVADLHTSDHKDPPVGHPEDDDNVLHVPVSSKHDWSNSILPTSDHSPPEWCANILPGPVCSKHEIWSTLCQTGVPTSSSLLSALHLTGAPKSFLFQSALYLIGASIFSRLQHLLHLTGVSTSHLDCTSPKPHLF